ncbi:hypothetical protein HOP50_01g09590 [Chloropicon primus]|uniref:EF-hand domain-containing protein n=1 Tax=Chloropicon primus TaxID=1764295 RepID=A0A5B8MFL9_9CHLO|nr:hypothetical protein A3770_01p09730 [Chloropicon primus]UPQ97664.1 hypothetical protein HOP50_01g09590 [Chloropicon primus]|eukprot:QDZ18455.1 hypothetical protein A3770_01p09730 [Chloropicon primus]
MSTIKSIALVALVALAGTTAVSANNKETDFEKKFCREFPSDKSCVQFCLDHAHKYQEQCADNIEGFCVRNINSGDQRCLPFLRKFCPDHAKNGACAEFCEEHPHKCGGGKQPHNQCVFNGSGRSSGGALGATTRSTSDQPVEVSGPSHTEIQEAFESLQEQPEMLGATRGPPPPPGQLPIDDLKPLLEKLGVTLSRSDLRTVKRQLDPNRTGYFSLTSFFFWWSTYMVCTSILG